MLHEGQKSGEEEAAIDDDTDVDDDGMADEFEPHFQQLGVVASVWVESLCEREYECSIATPEWHDLLTRFCDGSHVIL